MTGHPERAEAAYDALVGTGEAAVPVLVAALGALGDRRAVPALARSLRREVGDSRRLMTSS